jgi:phosphatidylserine/phosphatidylglycerophosphate/cardiolipin synthase-like enzyme
MSDLRVSVGRAVEGTLRSAFAHARASIDAQFYSMDADTIGELNRAAARGVDVTIRLEGDPQRYQGTRPHVPDAGRVRSNAARYLSSFDHRVHVVVESDPLVLDHAKAAVVDGRRAFVCTANPNDAGFKSAGAVCVEDRRPADVSQVKRALLSGADAGQSGRVLVGPGGQTRRAIDKLLDSPHDLRIAAEDLSDPDVVGRLIERHALGRHDRVLVQRGGSDPALLQCLVDRHVDVRTLGHRDMHEKYMDDGDAIYVGSANLTRNGLDEAHEIGVVASACEFGSGATALRRSFDLVWEEATIL